MDSNMPNWGEEDAEMSPPPDPAVSSTSNAAANLDANQRNDNVPMETSFDQRSDEAMMATPGPSTGARRRDPRPPKRKSNRRPSHGHRNSQRNQRRFEKNRTVGIMSVPTDFTGVIIGKRGAVINDIENEAGVEITIGSSDGFNTDLTIAGSPDCIALARVLISDLILNVAKNSSELQDLVASFQRPVEQTDEACSVSQPQVFDYKAFCEYYRSFREEQIALLPPIVKDLYNENPEVAAMSPQAARNWRKNHYDMQVRRNSHVAHNLRPIPNPAISFEQIFGNRVEILTILCMRDILKPCPIQSQALPILLRGEDFICVAPDDTGKTLAVLLTALVHHDCQPILTMDRNEPPVLILVPCWTMVMKIKEELEKYQYRYIKIVYVCVEGDRNMQVSLLSRRVDIIIATPTRLHDLAMARYIKSELFSFVALLEIDSMIEMGHEVEIRNVLLNTRPDRQIVMTCAEWAIGVRLMALSFMNDPIQLKQGFDSKTVTQTVHVMEEKEKENVIIQFLAHMNPKDKAVVYCRSSETAANIGVQLTLRNIGCRFVYGDLRTLERKVALNDVVNGSVNILLVSDLACRDVNVFDMTHVINFEYPGELDEYVDRVDRSGRAGRSGIVLTCLTQEDWAYAREIVRILQATKQVVPDELEEMACKLETLSLRGISTQGDHASTPDQTQTE